MIRLLCGVNAAIWSVIAIAFARDPNTTTTEVTVAAILAIFWWIAFWGFANMQGNK